MSWIKFTDLKTNKTFDSREPLGSIKEGSNIKTGPNGTMEQTGPFTNEETFKYPSGKEVWIDDYKEWKRDL